MRKEIIKIRNTCRRLLKKCEEVADTKELLVLKEFRDKINDRNFDPEMDFYQTWQEILEDIIFSRIK